MKRVLYFTDKEEGSGESAIDLLFGRYLRNHCHVDIVRFSRDKRGESIKNEEGILVPVSARRDPLRFIDPEPYDRIIVRNRFDLFFRLRRGVGKTFKGKIGFQLTFPHSYRRLHQAEKEGRALWRKKIEYGIRRRFEEYNLRSSDFFLPISEEMVREFYPKLVTPVFPLPMGIDPEELPQGREGVSRKDELRCVYIGTVDPLRSFDRFLRALVPLKELPWSLDVFTAQKEELKRALPSGLEGKVRTRDVIPREALISRMAQEYDLGIFVLPEHRLYRVASPTKVMDYYQAGIPALMSEIPECRRLFDEQSGLFASFEEERLREEFLRALNLPKNHLQEMGKRGREILLRYRNYRIMAKELYDFLEKI